MESFTGSWSCLAVAPCPQTRGLRWASVCLSVNTGWASVISHITKSSLLHTGIVTGGRSGVCGSFQNSAEAEEVDRDTVDTTGHGSLVVGAEV